MRIIPVIDLLNNQAVHAVKGEREQYKPIESILCDSSDPIEIATAFRDQLGFNEIYIADLDAIRDAARSSHRRIIDTLVSQKEFKVILDAGTSDIESVNFWLDSGIHRVVIGSETLKSLGDLGGITEAANGSRLILSLDCRSGKILSRCPELSDLPAVEAMGHIHSFGIREIILLDLDRVGSGCGINLSLTLAARASFPNGKLLAGGGVTGPADIRRLQTLRVDGALIATALHRGTISAEQLTGICR